MRSHTVPKKLLEHFAYDDPVTKSKRLWRYEKGRPPYGEAAPKTATRWDGHFADPDDAAKEAAIETRLQREFENPVNQFIDLLKYDTFPFTTLQKRLLTGYVTMLFHRSRARRASSAGQHNTMIAALRAIRDNDDMLGQLIAKQTMALISGGRHEMPTHEQARAAIDSVIAEHDAGDVAQRRYIATTEHMMELVDEGMRNGDWRILQTELDKPFIIGDAPVVTWERTDRDVIILGQGFGRPNVEVFLPVFPTACLHVRPAVQRSRPVRVPTIDEVNQAEAEFATLHCFTNVESKEIDVLLQPHFGKSRLGIEAFSTRHFDSTKQLFEFLMNRRWEPAE